VKAALELARRRVGALVVVERSADLSDLAGSGLRVDAAVTAELLVAIFQRSSPIHDGAAVVQGTRVAAAACLLPLSAAPAAPELGTRHRAAIGLVEEADAAVVVVSEERGEISVALDGALHRALDEKALRAILYGAFVGAERGGDGGLAALVRARTRGEAGREGPRAAL
jgi:diadenylate cyclase